MAGNDAVVSEVDLEAATDSSTKNVSLNFTAAVTGDHYITISHSPHQIGTYYVNVVEE